MKPGLLIILAASGLIALTAQQSPKPAVYTTAQAAAGRAAYLTTCALCHTANLTGRKGDPGELPPLDALSEEMQIVVSNAGGQVPPLTGAAFMAKWETTRDLSRRVNEAVGGFPPLGRDKNTYLNLTAYFLQVSGARPGAQDLTAATAVRLSDLR
jgi:hypothetical protein